MGIILDEGMTQNAVNRMTGSSVGKHLTQEELVAKRRKALNRALMIRGLMEQKAKAATHTDKRRIEERVRDIENEIREAY